MQHQRPTQLPETDAAAGQRRLTAVAEVGGERRFDVGDANAAPGQFVSIAALGEERFRIVERGGTQHRLLEGELLEPVERVLGDEGVDRPLRGQEAGGVGHEPGDLAAGVR
jgi:hypothetical protein